MLSEIANAQRGSVFFAADDLYFRNYGADLIRSSIEKNPSWRVFVHLYDPSKESLHLLDGFQNLSFSSEVLDEAYFIQAAQKIKALWKSQSTENIDKANRICRTIKAHDRSRIYGILSHLVKIDLRFIRFAPEALLISYLKKVYYSCQRFVVLEKLLSAGSISGDVLALDADSIFNNSLPSPLPHQGCDVAIKHRKSKKSQNFLAGAILIPCAGGGVELLKKLSEMIALRLANYELEWGLDQVLLNTLIPQFNWQQLDNRLGDLEFHPESSVWLAKGNTKGMLKKSSR